MNSYPSSSSASQSSAFDMLAEPVRRWIWDKGWGELHDIQERAIYTLLSGERDLIIAAPTAGGKTEAAFLPLISSVLAAPGEGGFDLVYVAPLKALINDQLGRTEDLCKQTDLPVYPWHGDISQGVKSRARANPKGILLITPESLEALFVLRGLQIPSLFMGTRSFIIDELHALLDNERGVHLRSLLSRLERAVGRQIRRVGLSATLSDMEMVKEYLRPGAPEDVDLLESGATGAELRVQIRGYTDGDDDDGDDEEEKEEEAAKREAAKREVTKHLFSRLRGKPNLVFAGSRQNVEWYADALREMSEKAKVPVDFLPHHANLSREHRNALERSLKTRRTTTAICTSTLELGIDIGDIECVAQIGPPFSVASLRQRLGRSGRRPGQPAVLRMYAIEREPRADSHPLDRLHLDLVQSIAMVELLRDRWCEPPAPQSLHLSTLCHQVLSVIAERGGVNAGPLYEVLCGTGPFKGVSPTMFARLLRDLGSLETALIEQAPDGTLLLGPKGEKLVEHYSFYAVFQTAEEFRVVTRGRQIGSLPATSVFVPEMTIIFSGKRWRITQVHSRERVIEVSENRTGRPPPFGGTTGQVHDRIIEKMRDVLSDKQVPAYIDGVAARLLERARSEFLHLRLDSRSICEVGEKSALVATWAGTVKTYTLALLLKNMGYGATVHHGFLEVENRTTDLSVESALRDISRSPTDLSRTSLPGLEERMSEKFHCYLSSDLLYEDAVTSVVDLAAMPQLTEDIIRVDASRSFKLKVGQLEP